MKSDLRRLIASAAVGYLGAAAPGCSALCADSGSWTDDSGSCSVSRYALKVSCRSSRIDLRQAPELMLQTELRRNEEDELRALAAGETPSVQLSSDGATSFSAPAAVTADRRSVQASLSGQPVEPGPLRAQVSLSTGASVSTADGGKPDCRAFLSPRFGAPEEVKFELSPRGNVRVLGAVAVQIGSVFDGRGSVLLTEQYEGIMSARRWLEQYREGPQRTLVRARTSAWSSKQNLLDESGSALFATTRDAIVVYGTRTGGTRNDLSVIPLATAAMTRWDDRSTFEPMIPTDASALAAATDDSLVLIGRPGQVQWFRIRGDSNTESVKYVGAAAVSGTPVIAARGELAAKPREPSGAYFGVAWGDNQKATLLKATARDAAGSQDLQPVPLGADAQRGFDQGLGGARVTATALADLDRDGLQDLIAADAQGRLWWSPQLPDGQFAAPAALSPSVPTDVESLSVGDINGDNLPDLVAATSLVSKKVLVLRSQ